MTILKHLKKHRVYIIGLFIASFLIRGAIFYWYFSHNNNYWQVDSPSYHDVAIFILKGIGICHPDGSYNLLRLPGYPFFLTACYLLFGINPQAALWIQIVIGSLIPPLIFLLTLELFANKNLAKITSLYSVLSLGLIIFSNMLMSETLFLFSFLLFLYLFLPHVHPLFCHTKQQQSSNLFWSGIILGIATMIRPVGHYIMALSILLIILSWQSYKIVLKKTITLIVGWLPVVAPWLVRNFLLTGYLFFHTLPGGHFISRATPRIVMQAQNCSYENAMNYLGPERTALRKKYNHITQQSVHLRNCLADEEVAKSYFKKYPLLTSKIWLFDMTRTLLSLYSSELLFIESGKKHLDEFSNKRTLGYCINRYLFPDTVWRLIAIIWLEMIFHGLILLGLLLQFLQILSLCIKEKTLVPACMLIRTISFIALFLFLSGGSVGYARLRIPIEPLLIIVSLVFWYDYFTKRKTICSSI